MDTLTIAGVLLGLLAILGGQVLEGSDIASLINAPAFLIVIGGTLAAVLLQSPYKLFSRSLQMSSWVLSPPRHDFHQLIEKMLDWSHIARKEGLPGLEGVVDLEHDPFIRKGLQLMVEGTEPEVIRDIMELDLGIREQEEIKAANVYSSMAGYSPTMGILGAVMGLIHVMQNLSDPGQLGNGIATAFVATIYGVGLANLVLLPMANKLKAVIAMNSRWKEAIIEGVVAIAEGDNPRYIEARLKSYL